MHCAWLLYILNVNICEIGVGLDSRKEPCILSSKAHKWYNINYTCKYKLIQSDLTKYRSCLTNVLETFESWTEDVDQEHSVDVILLDFQKAKEVVASFK